MHSNTTSGLLQEIVLNEKTKLLVSEYENPNIAVENTNMRANANNDSVRISLLLELTSKSLLNVLFLWIIAETYLSNFLQMTDYKYCCT